jgi:hypothetical protein
LDGGNVAVGAQGAGIGKGAHMSRSVTGILIVIVLILLVVFLLQRV